MIETVESCRVLPQGWFSSRDIRVYRDLVAQVPGAGTFAELGVWKGRSLCSVSDIVCARHLTVYAVDTFQGSAGEAEHIEARSTDIHAHCQEALRSFGIASHVQIFAMTTTEAATHVPDASLDLVFVDADHRYESVRQDILRWLPKLTLRGVMAGHDWAWPSVRRAVEESFADRVMVNGDIWMWKTPCAAVVA